MERGGGGVEGKGKQDRIKDRMEVQESDKEWQVCGNMERKEDIKESYLVR